MTADVISVPEPACSTEPQDPIMASPLDCRPDPLVELPALRQVPVQVLSHLLRSAVALQAEGVLRTAGALSGDWGDVLDRTVWIERDARDLSALAAVAVRAGAKLPAGVDSGAGDPAQPSSALEGMVAGHTALIRVLRQLAGSECVSNDHSNDHSNDQQDVSTEPWRAVVVDILARREEEMVQLLATHQIGQPPAEETYQRGLPHWA